MKICKTIEHCHVATSFNHDGVLLSVGAFCRDDACFIIFCAQDAVLGCQHIHTRQVGAVIMVENVARAVRLLSSLRR